MKKSSLAILLSALAVSASFAADKECPTVATTVRTEVTAKPENVLTIVSEKIAANPSCACEIVKAAIEAAKADKDLVGQIVFTAVTAAPTEATTVAECAVSAAPEAADSIKAALKRAMSDDKNPVSSSKNPKNPDKNVVVKEDDAADFGLSPVAIGGVYLIYPSGGGSGVRLGKQNGRTFIIGPDGKKVFLDGDNVTGGGRPNRPSQGGGGTTPTTTEGTPVVDINSAK